MCVADLSARAQEGKAHHRQRGPAEGVSHRTRVEHDAGHTTPSSSAVGPYNLGLVSATFSAEELAAEVQVDLGRIDWLTRIGILKPPAPDRFTTADAFRVKMISALLEAGFAPGQIEDAASNGMLTLDHFDQLVPPEPPPLSDRTFEEFAAARGPEAAENLASVYQVLGFPEPDPHSPIPRDEEELFDTFLRAWGLARDDETLVRAARLIGEGTRTVALGWPDLFAEQVAGPVRERFYRGEVGHFPADVRDTGLLLVTLIPRLMEWLTQKYMEQRIVSGIVDGLEGYLAHRGLVSRDARQTRHAVVFTDLSGYTRLTEVRGDEVAAGVAATLQQLAESTAREHEGRLVKLLGDGAMLHFRDAGQAVRAGVALVRDLGADVELDARAGVAAGPVVERDRDLFGRTVNLAARIAEQAGPGEVLVTEDVTKAATDEAISFDTLGETRLKGFDDPVPLFRAVAGDRA
jgi:adenylate cyclase